MNIALASLIGAFLGVLMGFLLGVGIFYWKFRQIKNKAIERIKKQSNVINQGFDFNAIKQSYSKSEGLDLPKSKWELTKEFLTRPLVLIKRRFGR